MFFIDSASPDPPATNAQEHPAHPEPGITRLVLIPQRGHITKSLPNSKQPMELTHVRLSDLGGSAAGAGASLEHPILSQVVRLETASYPSDEAATPAKLQLRAERAANLFAVAVAPGSFAGTDVATGTVVGFVCGTLTSAPCLTEESMAHHEPDGARLCIHSVVTAPAHRRQGVASALLRWYLYEALPNDPGLGHVTQVELLAKAGMVPFYTRIGFTLFRRSPVEHGREHWFEMGMWLRGRAPVACVDAFSPVPFAGNPAAVVLLPPGPPTIPGTLIHSAAASATAADAGAAAGSTPPSKRARVDQDSRRESWMRNVAQEMNLSETAFLVPLAQERFVFPPGETDELERALSMATTGVASYPDDCLRALAVQAMGIESQDAALSALVSLCALADAEAARVSGRGDAPSSPATQLLTQASIPALLVAATYRALRGASPFPFTEVYGLVNTHMTIQHAQLSCTLAARKLEENEVFVLAFAHLVGLDALSASVLFGGVEDVQAALQSAPNNELPPLHGTKSVADAVVMLEPAVLARAARSRSRRDSPLNFKSVLFSIDAAAEAFVPQGTFCVGPVVNDQNTNLGSLKVLAFASAMNLDEHSTLELWGEHYHSVRADPYGTAHANIRAFMKHGWAGVRLPENVLQMRDSRQLAPAVVRLHLARDVPSFELRWLTPAVEVDLCGHATLASAHALFHVLRPSLRFTQQVRFETRSGALLVRRVWSEASSRPVLEMNFPSEAPHSPVDTPVVDTVVAALGLASAADVLYVGRNRMDAIVEISRPSFEAMRGKPPVDLGLIAAIPQARGLVVTTAGPSDGKYDFESRGFFPAAGIAEDPVTGSAHCALGPYWLSKRSTKGGSRTFRAFQASARGGELGVEVSEDGSRVLLRGEAAVTWEGVVAGPQSSSDRGGQGDM